MLPTNCSYGSEQAVDRNGCPVFRKNFYVKGAKRRLRRSESLDIKILSKLSLAIAIDGGPRRAYRNWIGLKLFHYSLVASFPQSPPPRDPSPRDAACDQCRATRPAWRTVPQPPAPWRVFRSARYRRSRLER